MLIDTSRVADISWSAVQKFMDDGAVYAPLFYMSPLITISLVETIFFHVKRKHRFCKKIWWFEK